MSLTLKDTLSVMVDGNKGAAKASAKRRTGKMLNDRLVALIKPQLPFWAKGYADTEIGRATISNVLAAAIVHFGYTNEKLLLASDAMVTAAMDDLIGSFNIEGMVNEFLDGVNLDGLKDTTDTVRGGAGTILRKASDVVTPEDKEAANG